MRKSDLQIGMLSLILLASLSANSQAALVAHWKLDDGTGQIVTDAVGSNNGTLGANSGVAADDPTWSSTAKIGTYSLSFNGSSTWVNFGDVLDMGANDFTTSVWIQANSSLGTTNGTSGRIFQKRGTGVPGAVPGWQVVAQRIDSTNFRMDNLVWDDGGTNTPTGRVGWISSNGVANDPPNANMTRALNQWHNVTTVFDNTNSLWSFYINGVLAQQVSVGASFGSVNNNNSLTLGAADVTGPVQFFGGRIDDPGMFSGALGASYAGAIYSLGNEAALNYDLSLVQDLFDVYEETSSSASISGLTWTRTTGLSTPLGVVTEIDGAYYLMLNADGSGVTSYVAPIPEPTSLLSLGGLLGMVCLRRRKRSPGDK